MARLDGRGANPNSTVREGLFLPPSPLPWFFLLSRPFFSSSFFSTEPKLLPGGARGSLYSLGSGHFRRQPSQLRLSQSWVQLIWEIFFLLFPVIVGSRDIFANKEGNGNAPHNAGRTIHGLAEATLFSSGLTSPWLLLVRLAKHRSPPAQLPLGHPSTASLRLTVPF